MTTDEPEQEMSADDLRALERELEHLERTDPAVAEAARRYDDMLMGFRERRLERHEDLLMYLRAHGWVARPVPHRPLTEWTFEVDGTFHQFLLPEDPSLMDYPVALGRALRVIGEAEGVVGEEEGEV